MPACARLRLPVNHPASVRLQTASPDELDATCTLCDDFGRDRVALIKEDWATTDTLVAAARDGGFMCAAAQPLGAKAVAAIIQQAPRSLAPIEPPQRRPPLSPSRTSGARTEGGA